MAYEVVETIRDFGLTLQYPVGATMKDEELPPEVIKSLLDAGVIKVQEEKPKKKSKGKK